MLHLCILSRSSSTEMKLQLLHRFIMYAIFFFYSKMKDQIFLEKETCYKNV